MPRQLHHVVGAAAFRRAWSQLAGELAWIRVPRFTVAGSAGAIRAFAHHFIPEILRDVPIALISRQFVVAGGGDHLRNVCVYVQAFEFVTVSGQWIEELLLVEALCHFKVILLAGYSIEIRENLTHSAKLGAKHTLHMLVAERTRVSGGPVRHLLDHFESLLVARVNVH